MLTIQTQLTLRQLREALGALGDIPALDVAVTPLSVAARVGEGVDLARGQMVVDPFTGEARVDVKPSDDTRESRFAAKLLAAAVEYQLETLST